MITCVDCGFASRHALAFVWRRDYGWLCVARCSHKTFHILALRQ